MITRRNFNKLLLGTIAVGCTGLAGRILYNLLTTTNYEQAFHDSELRYSWLQGLESRFYARKVIATPEILEQLKKQHNYVPPQGSFAATFSNDKANIGRGCSSTIYVFPECFDNVYRNNLESMAVIVENALNNHELFHADHYFAGIPEFSLNLSQDEQGRFNPILFTLVSEIMCYKNEAESLGGNNDSIVKAYRAGLQQLINNYFRLLTISSKNKELIERVRILRK